MASSSRAAVPCSIIPHSSTPPRTRWKHDVFLSFRGKDTRNNFTAHLCGELRDGGIMVYMDDRDLGRGEDIESTLWMAIEQSRFSIVIFSEDYASSPWCMAELVKIVECLEKKGQTVFPVFYHVDPSEVAKQTGKYGDAFVQHEESFKTDTKKVQSWREALTKVANLYNQQDALQNRSEMEEEVDSWRNALTRVANLSGWDVRNRNEREVIKEIGELIWNKVRRTFPSISNKDLVGMDSRVDKMDRLLRMGLADIRMVGICGMGGIGKTTIARVVFDRIRWEFSGSCFVSNVREEFEKHGAKALQERLLSEIVEGWQVRIWDDQEGKFQIQRRLQNKKVLIVLDDVTERRHLQMLAEEHWFGLESRVIITSRDERLLRDHGVTKIFMPDKLNGSEALTLLSRKAFKQDEPAVGYLKLSSRVLTFADGLPLALEVVGNSLFDRPTRVWKSVIDRLHEEPDGNIMNVLRISFEGLENQTEKDIFLDIACFFKGMDEDEVKWILDSCGLFASIGIEVLKEKSLLSISDNKIWMHDLLQLMGMNIVHQQSDEPGRRSRLWTYEELSHVLTAETGTKKVKAIVLALPEKREERWNMEAFSKMKQLRLLIIRNMHLFQGPIYLSSNLGFVEWHGYPSESLPSCFQPDKLAVVNLSYGSIKRLWPDIKVATKLKVMNLSYCQYLSESPDFSKIPNLERLILEGCKRLSIINPSFGLLKKIVFVSLAHCESLKSLPSNLEMKSLKVFILSGCVNLEQFPNVSNLTSVETMDLSGCSKLGRMGQAFTPKELMLSNWLCPSAEIGGLHSFTGMYALKKLDLSYCNLGGVVPIGPQSFPKLSSLNLSGNNFASLPTSITGLSVLEELKLENCKLLQSLPELPPQVFRLVVNGCTSLDEIPDQVKLCRLFYCFNCFKLRKNPGWDGIAIEMLRRYFQARTHPRFEFGIVVPGSRIPQWFRSQKEGSSVAMIVPVNLDDDEEWIGYSACVAFSADVVASPAPLHLFCKFKSGNSAECRHLTTRYEFTIGTDFTQAVGNHLWLLFIASGFFRNRGGAFDELSFKICGPDGQPVSSGISVKRCGARLVYEKDVKQLRQVTSGYDSSIFEEFNDSDPEFTGGTSSEHESHNGHEQNLVHLQPRIKNKRMFSLNDVEENDFDFYGSTSLSLGRKQQKLNSECARSWEKSGLGRTQ